MAMIHSTLKIGDQPSEQILQEINSAAKYEPNLEAMPELSEEALKDFTIMAKEKQSIKNSVSIELSQKDLQAYKSLGVNYIKIMANVLSNALKQPNFLREANSIYKVK